MGDLDLILDRLCCVRKTGRSVALMFDYDGTLAPLRPTPEEAMMPASTRRALARLITSPQTAVAVISGRALTDVSRMVGLDGAYYAGTSGLELDLLGRRVYPPGAERTRAFIDQMAGRLTDLAGRYPGAWLEQKPYGLTLHYRAVEVESVPRLHDEARALLAPWRDALRLEDVTLGLEIVPNIGWDKGTAVHAILADLGEDVYPVYAGDAANDAPALAAVEAIGGLSIGVGPVAPPAIARLLGPGAVGSLAIMLAVAFQDANCLAAAR